MPRDQGRGREEPRLVFEAMFVQHYSRVLAYSLRRAPGTAQDVVSEVFLTAWRRLEEVPADALPWLLGVARKVIANDRRAIERRPTVSLVDLDRTGDPDAGAFERLEVAEAFRRLPEQDREILMLVAWDGLSPARAARVLGCSTPAFYVRLHRARTRLSRALEAPDAAALTPREVE